jgi:hypothetical protein
MDFLLFKAKARAGLIKWSPDSLERFMLRLSMIALLLVRLASPGNGQKPTQPPEAVQSAAQPATEKINPPFVIEHPAPEYSERFQATHAGGRCVAKVTVSTSGAPKEIKLIRCSDPIYAKGFLDAVAKFKYRPATTQQGKPVEAEVTEMITVEFDDRAFSPKTSIGYSFSSPPNTVSSEPGADGVYPFTKKVTPPSLTKFSDEGYGDAAFGYAGNSHCDIVLTISAKGKASDPSVTHCEKPRLENLAVQSLLKSKYKPGSVNGKAVAIRATVHLEYDDVPAKP